jgi:ATP-dependent exoDNAse (exonuclease V) alpha subunit
MGLLTWLKGGAQGSSIPPTQAVDLELTDEFKRALALIESGVSPILITGGAGTGKSALLQYFRKTTKKRVVVLAPTGMAAVNVRGVTIHSFFKFPPTLIQQTSIKTRRDKTEMFRSLDTLIVDEVSMVRADLMDGIDWSLRLHTGKSALFGGVQVVLFGDLAQLPPVVKEDKLKDYFETHYESKFFFSADALKEIPMQIQELTKIFRQARDVDFAQVLRRIRSNEYTLDDLASINTRYVSPNKTSSAKEMLVLTTTNSSATETNLARTAELKSPERTYTAQIEGAFPEEAFPAEKLLRLKNGAQVMMLKNNGTKWVNGSIGNIVRCNDQGLLVQLPTGVHVVEPEEWEVIDYDFNPATRKLEEKVIGKFTQLPVRLAWAITIHKSQGQTFEAVDIDMHSGAFAHGQLYVALSRCKSLAGVRLRKLIGPEDVIFDSKVFDKMQQWGLIDSRVVSPTMQPTRTMPEAQAGLPLPNKAPRNDDGNRTIVQRAMDDGHRLEIEYVDGSGTTSKRIVSPRDWFDSDKFSAYCHLRKSEREFRISRISGIRALD